MLIDQFNLSLEEASQFPFLMWKQNYLLARKSFLADLTSIKSGLNKKTTSLKKLDVFLALLEKQDPTERELAEGFVSLGEIFQSSSVANSKLETYLKSAERFLKRVLNEERFAVLRQSVKKSMSTEKQREYSNRLFQNEGLNYCLLYYLTYYKTLIDIESAAEKNAFIAQKEINLGFGRLPGIRDDFAKDESLEKFILLIPDDDTRQRLLWEYYLGKQVILRAKTFMEVEATLHEFIFAFLTVFDQQGIKMAANAFFVPYGKKATIKEILPLFQAKYVPRN